MRDGGLVGAGIVFGWLLSKSWSDPECRLGLVIFLVATAVMFLVFALAVVGHGKKPRVVSYDGKRLNLDGPSARALH